MHVAKIDILKNKAIILLQQVKWTQQCNAHPTPS